MLVFLAADESRLDELDSATRDYLGWKHVLANEADLDLTQNQKNQASTRQAQADQTVNSRLLQTFTWALVPSQPDASAPFILRETKIEGQSESLAERVSRRLGNDGDLSVRQAAVTIRLAINKVPQIWRDGHVLLGSLWGLYCQYPYMPRLRDRRVLEEGVLDLPMIWETDAFALATGIDAATGRYVGLWIPGDTNSAPPPADSLLLVRPDVALHQRQHEAPEEPRHDTATEAGAGTGAGQASTTRTIVDSPTGPGPMEAAFTRFYGVKTLSPDKIAMDFKNIADEVLANLRDEGIKLKVRIEIEAVDESGFDEGKLRTVSENAKTLKFDQSGFEKE